MTTINFTQPILFQVFSLLQIIHPLMEGTIRLSKSQTSNFGELLQELTQLLIQTIILICLEECLLTAIIRPASKEAVRTARDLQY